MPVPTWVAQLNKRVFNPMEIRRGRRPVLVHVGRTSGVTHATPLDAHPVEDGFLFFAMYGAARTDWIKNVMAAGSAVLRLAAEEIPLTSPELIDERAARTILPASTKLPASLLNVTEYLHMKRRT